MVHGVWIWGARVLCFSVLRGLFFGYREWRLECLGSRVSGYRVSGLSVLGFLVRGLWVFGMRCMGFGLWGYGAWGLVLGARALWFVHGLPLV